MGFWIGPHAEEIYMDYSFIPGSNKVLILLSCAKRGEYTESMRMDQYERPSDVSVYERFGTENTESCGDCLGTVESKQLIKISFDRKLKEKLDVYVQYSYANWKNTGFDPRNPLPDDVLPDITKHSIGFGLRYRY